ncbi:MAG: ABC transporter ATP-binding protein [Sulfuricurvum sp. PC08-66]|nr:MAG: ABC transporter ATP-binding protein [Sulfuricurvum sp. PC08-66]
MKIEKLLITHAQKTLVDISLDVSRATALVGQSGSGKSLTLKALLGMLPSTMESHVILDCEYARGSQMAFVPQNPFTALSPLTRVRDHFEVSSARQKELMALVGLDGALLERFAPELSGGQLQRIVIALALEHAPKVLLLDEPTTALDSTNKNAILAMLGALQQELGFVMLYVTHDIESVMGLCDTIAVLSKGRIVEQGSLQEVVHHPQNAYTQALLAASFSKREFRQ